MSKISELARQIKELSEKLVKEVKTSANTTENTTTSEES